MKTDFLATFEENHRSFSRDLKDERKPGELKAIISNLVNVYWSLYKPTQNTLRKHGILKKLRTRKNHCNSQNRQRKWISNPEWRYIYDQKTLEIINNTSKFKILKDSPTLTREGQLQNFLRNINDKNLFDENMYKNIYLCPSKLATIYSVPKTYKMIFDSDDFSLRPIISSIGTNN